MDKLKTWYVDAVFVGTNYAMRAGLIKDKWARRKLSEVMCSRVILKGAYKPSAIIKLMPRFYK